jgi:alpha-N-arabinofuranosidase
MRPTYHVLWMYANLLADHVAEAWVNSDPYVHAGARIPALDAVVTCDVGMRNWRIALINRHAEDALTCQVVIDGQALSGTYSATQLVGDHIDAYNDVGHTDRVFPLPAQVTLNDGRTVLPPHSLTIVEIG